MVLLVQPWVLAPRRAAAALPFCSGPEQGLSTTTPGCLPTPAECATGRYNGVWTARSADGSIIGTAECKGGPDGNGERHIDSYVGGTGHPVCGTSAADDRLTGLFWMDPNECLVPAGEPKAGKAIKGLKYRDAVDGTGGVVASPSPQASQVGIDMLADGGNAIDAAVATALAVGTARPDDCGIGGGGNLLARTAADGKAYALDFQRSGPAALRKDTYSSADFPAQKGHKMVGVPGVVAGMDAVLTRLGTRTLAQALQGAINLAEKGVEVSDRLAQMIHRESARLKEFQSTEKVFFRDDRLGVARVPYPPGSILRQPDLATSLRAIAKEGPAAFYAANGVLNDGIGDVADLMVEEMKAERDRKGVALLTADDLRSYTPRWREPLAGSYHRHGILTMPPPTMGFTVQEVLNILEAREDLDLRTIPHSTANWAHVITEAHKIARADWAWIGDPDFVTVPIEKLTSKGYAKQRAEDIDLEFAKNFRQGTFDGRSSKTGVRGDAPHTAHISVVDAAGNAVALTCSLGPSFGSAVVPAGAGFPLNANGGYSLYDADHPNDDDPNLAGPGKRSAYAHTPTMVVRGGRAVLVLGAAGGDAIPMGVVNVIVNVIDYRFDDRYPVHVARAVDAARVQADPVPVENNGRSLVIEDGRIADHVLDELRSKGHPVRGVQGLSRRDRNYEFGPLVQVAGDLGATRFAVTDPRAQGSLDGGPKAQP